MTTTAAASRRLGPLIAFTVLCSLAVALFAAWWFVVRDATPSNTVTPDQLVSGGAVGSSISGEATEGQPAPDTSFLTFDGSVTRLSDLRGRTVVINFWASSCAPCLAEMPAIESVFRQLDGDGWTKAGLRAPVTFLGVDVSEATGPGRAMIRRTGVTYPQARDPKGVLVQGFGGIALPHTVVIGPDGVVTALHNKALDAGELRGLLGAS